METVQRTYFDNDGNLIVKPYQMRQLAEIYEVHPRTMRRWISKLAPNLTKEKRRYFTIDEVVTIVNAIGIPHTIKVKKTA